MSHRQQSVIWLSERHAQDSCRKSFPVRKESSGGVIPNRNANDLTALTSSAMSQDSGMNIAGGRLQGAINSSDLQTLTMSSLCTSITRSISSAAEESSSSDCNKGRIDHMMSSANNGAPPIIVLLAGQRWAVIEQISKNQILSKNQISQDQMNSTRTVYKLRGVDADNLNEVAAFKVITNLNKAERLEKVMDEIALLEEFKASSILVEDEEGVVGSDSSVEVLPMKKGVVMKDEQRNRVVQMKGYAVVQNDCEAGDDACGLQVGIAFELAACDFAAYLSGRVKNQNVKTASSGPRHLELHTLLRYWLQMVACVQTVHDAGVVHFDVKCENFLVFPEDEAVTSCKEDDDVSSMSGGTSRGFKLARLKLADFGIASRIVRGDGGDAGFVKRQNVLQGTVKSMAPETVYAHFCHDISMLIVVRFFFAHDSYVVYVSVARHIVLQRYAYICCNIDHN